MAKKLVTHRERMEACLGNGTLDRVPVALWRHFPVDDQHPESLAAATIQFQKTYDFDFVKVTPASSFCLKDLGSEDIWRGSSEGTRDYIRFPINDPEDWLKIGELDPKQGHLGNQLHCLRLITQELDNDVPVIQTVFNPLSQAKNLISKELLIIHLRKYPEAVLEGLKRITQNTIAFINEAKKIGISGIFFAVQHAQYGLLTEEEYLKFGKVFDMQILEKVQDFWLNILHLHGEDVMFSMVTDYPISVVNWHDQDTPPSLKMGKELFDGVVCGGLQRYHTLVLGSTSQVMQECRSAIDETEGASFILGTGCVVPITAPYGNIQAVRRSVELL